MLKQRVRLVENRAEMKSMAPVYDQSRIVDTAWFATLTAAAFAGVFFFFGSFFGFSRGRVLSEG